MNRTTADGQPDAEGFRAACFEAARRTGGAVRDFHPAAGPTPSFHQVIIAYPDRVVAVVKDRAGPRLAIAEPPGPGDSGPLTFVELPALSAALADAGFDVLTKAWLDRPFRAEEHPGLDPGDVAYWRPATVGEALFTYWD